MPDIVLHGLTWNHRRAVDPLVGTMPSFRARRPDVDIIWSRRPLHAFEFAPVHQFAEQYDRETSRMTLYCQRAAPLLLHMFDYSPGV